MSKKRVFVAMSGGVDSSVAAFLLKKEGFEVVGVTMCFGFKDSKGKRPSCCSESGIQDARRVAEQLDINHYVMSFGLQLKEKVIGEFVKEYLSGRTPNPCIRCNQYLKFDELIKRAKELSCDYLATGHYARLVQDKKTQRRLSQISTQMVADEKNNGQFFLKRAKDTKKDQSYFLFRIPKDKMDFILFPLGNYTKDEVRKIARENKLRVADKPASQEICFVGTNYHEFLKHELPRILKTTASTNKIMPGPIIDTKGNILGKHQGICFYTIGQREGLGIALGYRAYVVKIDARKNIIVVGKEDELYSDGLIAEDIHFIGLNRPKKSISCKAKIRYNHKEAACRITFISKNQLRVEFLEPQRAITPGQSVVFYKNNTIIGGATIERVL